MINRKEANNAIMRILEIYLKQNPDIRFNQALINLDIVEPYKDDFYTEPENVLLRMRRVK